MSSVGAPRTPAHPNTAVMPPATAETRCRKSRSPEHASPLPPPDPRPPGTAESLKQGVIEGVVRQVCVCVCLCSFFPFLSLSVSVSFSLTLSLSLYLSIYLFLSLSYAVQKVTLITTKTKRRSVDVNAINFYNIDVCAPDEIFQPM